MEKWKDIVGAEGYQVSDLGRVRSVDRVIVDRAGREIRRRGVILKATAIKTPSGRVARLNVRVTADRPQSVHRLVLEAFVGPCPPGLEGCHRDGDSSNNALSNLRWDTHESNVEDCYKHGTLKRGVRRQIERIFDGPLDFTSAHIAAMTGLI